MKTVIFSLCLTLLLSLSTTGLAAAETISKEQAVSIASKAAPGRVLSVKRDENVYKVKTLSKDGTVRIIVVDASNGKILSN